MQNNEFIFRLLNISLKLLPAFFWLLLIFAFDLPHIAIITLISVIIHECGHIFALCVLTDNFVLKTETVGFRIKPKKRLSYMEETIIAAAGPLSNIAIFILLIPFYGSSEYIFTFGLLNLFTSISNLLPIESYDGYRILECSLLLLGFGNRGIRFLKIISFILLSLFSLVGLYFIKKLDTGYWIFFIFVLILIKTVKKDKTVFSQRKREKKRAFKRF